MTHGPAIQTSGWLWPQTMFPMDTARMMIPPWYENVVAVSASRVPILPFHRKSNFGVRGACHAYFSFFSFFFFFFFFLSFLLFFLVGGSASATKKRTKAVSSHRTPKFAKQLSVGLLLQRHRHLIDFGGKNEVILGQA